MQVPLYILIGVGFLTWLIFVLAIVKFCNFSREFEKFKARNDIELNNTIWNLKKAEETREKILIELQRTSKLLYDIYKGNKVTFYPDIEYKEEDALRHHKEEHIHNGVIFVNPPSHPDGTPGGTTNRGLIPLNRKSEKENRPPATTPQPATDPHQKIKVNQKIMTDDPYKKEDSPL